MKHPDPVLVFFMALLVWGFFLAAMVSSMGCGGAQKPCAMNRTGDPANPCREVQR